LEASEQDRALSLLELLASDLVLELVLVLV
jgi:hypothetical protein